MYLDNGEDAYKLSRSLGHSEIGTTEEYLKDFKSRDARKDHDSFSPVARLKQSTYVSSSGNELVEGVEGELTGSV